MLLLINLSQKKTPEAVLNFTFLLGTWHFWENQLTFCFWVSMTNITLLLRFTKATNFMMPTLLKLEIQKMLVVNGLSFAHGEEFSPIYQILVFYLWIPINEAREPTSNIFNSFGFIEFVLVLFPLCLFWTIIFLVKNWYQPT